MISSTHHSFVNAFTSERRRADYSSTKFRNVFWQRRLARLIPSFAFANLFFFPILVVRYCKFGLQTVHAP